MAGVRDVRRLAKGLGDFSTLGKREQIPARLARRFIIGKPGGKLFSMVRANFGVVGLLASAEFFAFFRDVVKQHYAKPVFFGSMAAYAAPVERGFVHYLSGEFIQPVPYWSFAVAQASQDSQNARHRGGGGRGITGLRSGLYDGQKFIGDFNAFFSGKMARRIPTRIAGREAGALYWGSWTINKGGIKDPPNVLVSYVNSVLVHARRNLRDFNRVDEGVLKASLQGGFTQLEFIDKSIKAMEQRIVSRGIVDQLERRIAPPTFNAGSALDVSGGRGTGA